MLSSLLWDLKLLDRSVARSVQILKLESTNFRARDHIEGGSVMQEDARWADAVPEGIPSCVQCM